MMVEEYELKRQQESSLWRTMYQLLSNADIDWKNEMPLPMIDVKKNHKEAIIPEDERAALLEKYAKAD